MAKPRLELDLPSFLKGALAGGHPWVYRDHVPKGFSAPTGSWILARAGNWSGWALWDAASPIALRVFSEKQCPDAEWIAERVRLAWALRAPLRAEGTSAYRLINGEGDGLPAIVVDVYAGWAVILTYVDAVESLVPWLVEALQRVGEFRGVLRRRRDEPKSERLECLVGRAPSRDLVVEEAGLRYRVDMLEGQKTGLFLDQRENRRAVGRLAGGATVLNLFSYTGGFSLRAAQGGATRVTSVDVAPGAIEAARDNFTLNGLDPEPHEFVVADVFEYLEAARRERRQFDLVISDPPSFAHSRDQLPQALDAYQRLTLLGLRLVRFGGTYIGSSCTAQVSPEAFRGLLAKAAQKARCRLQVFHDAGHAPDHPLMAQHLEGRYLKFLACRVLPIA
jgi:23S rRNA (cytosine1962-C5)-methyltransferase